MDRFGVIGLCAADILFCDSCICHNSYSASLWSFCIVSRKIMSAEYAFVCDEPFSSSVCRNCNFPKLIKSRFGFSAEVSHSKRNGINFGDINEEEILPSKAWRDNLMVWLSCKSTGGLGFTFCSDSLLVINPLKYNGNYTYQSTAVTIRTRHYNLLKILFFFTHTVHFCMNFTRNSDGIKWLVFVKDSHCVFYDGGTECLCNVVDVSLGVMSV